MLNQIKDSLNSNSTLAFCNMSFMVKTDKRYKDLDVFFASSNQSVCKARHISENLCWFFKNWNEISI